jgi:hypothetical protein
MYSRQKEALPAQKDEQWGWKSVYEYDRTNRRGPGEGKGSKYSE